MSTPDGQHQPAADDDDVADRLVVDFADLEVEPPPPVPEFPEEEEEEEEEED